MKKLFALLLTVVMMASMMVPAMAAYTVLTPGATETIDGVQHTNVTTIPHQLQLTREEDVRLDYNITYSYAVGNPVVVMAGATGNIGEDFNIDGAVTGKPSIDAITYGPSDTFTGDDKTCAKTLIVDWTEVEIKEPGVYRWEVTQSFATNAPVVDGKPSNASEKFYLYMYVTDTPNGLDAEFRFAKGFGSDGLPTTDHKPGQLSETYPAKTVDLILSKKVEGNQASKDQYFPFTITLTVPNAPDHTIEFVIGATPNSSYTLPKTPATAYHGEMSNPEKIVLQQGYTSSSVTVWLKHEQSVTIKDLIYGSQYTIVEGLYDGKTGYNDGYTVSADVSQGADKGSYDGQNTVTDTSMEDSANVAYTNTKTAVTPTGINLQSGIAFFGLVLAMGMMMLMFVGKRKEQN